MEKMFSKKVLGSTIWGGRGKKETQKLHNREKIKLVLFLVGSVPPPQKLGKLSKTSRTEGSKHVQMDHIYHTSRLKLSSAVKG